MNVSLLDIDGHNGFPNLALCKISAYHKWNGDSVSWFTPLYDAPVRLYASKVFTFTPDFQYWPDCETLRGGTGYDVKSKLPAEIEQMKPDLSIYPDFEHGLGFLTRGCIRRCPWCVVPEKEGGIKVVSDIEAVANGRKSVVLMDNNFLSAPSEFVELQLKTAIRKRIKLDFNQGLDARLMTAQNAVWLARVPWINHIRFACDSDAGIEPLERAVCLLHECGYRKEIFVYFLCTDDVNACLNRIGKIEYKIIGLYGKNRLRPFVQPYRDFECKVSITQEQNDLARWANAMMLYKSMSFHDYKPRQQNKNDS